MLWSYDQGILVLNILGSAEISWGLQWPIWSESFLPFLLSRIGLTISVPAFPLSDAVHCNRPRSALQPSSQCTATVPAVHCIRPCSALHPPLQCTASVLASTCIRPCKYVFFYRVCISPKPYLDSLWPIWHVSSVAQIHAQPISVGFERF